MSDSTEKWRQELQAAQRTIAALQSHIERSEAGRLLATRELEENRSALLFMLEDLEQARKKIELSYQEWMDALDAMRDPMFLHDKDFRILRCNKAYQQRAGIPFKKIIGQPYYEYSPRLTHPWRAVCAPRKLKNLKRKKKSPSAMPFIARALLPFAMSRAFMPIPCMSWKM